MRLLRQCRLITACSRQGGQRSGSIKELVSRPAAEATALGSTQHSREVEVIGRALFILLMASIGCQPGGPALDTIPRGALCLELSHDEVGRIWSFPRGLVLQPGADTGRAIAVESLDSVPPRVSGVGGTWSRTQDEIAVQLEQPNLRWVLRVGTDGAVNGQALLRVHLHEEPPSQVSGWRRVCGSSDSAA